MNPTLDAVVLDICLLSCVVFLVFSSLDRDFLLVAPRMALIILVYCVDLHMSEKCSLRLTSTIIARIA